MTKRFVALKWSLLLLTAFTVPIFADDSNSPFTWNFYYTSDFWTGLKGDMANRLDYIGNADLVLNIDNAKLLNWTGNSVLIEAQNLNGGNPDRYTHSLQGTDGITSNQNFTKLYQFWMQQNFSKQFSILAGLYDLSYYFYITPSSEEFQTAPSGLGSELAQSGRNGPGAYPISAMGMLLKYNFNPRYYLQTAINDGLAGNPNDTGSSSLRIATSYGVLMIAEAGQYFLDQSQNTKGKIAFGVWNYSQQAIEEDNSNKHQDDGAYGLIDYPLYLDPSNSNRGLHGFFRYGVASPAVNTFSKSLSTGVTYYGPIAARPNDTAGFAFSPAWISNPARQANNALPGVENDYELTYVAKINSKLNLQPDLQYVNFRGGDRAIYKNSINIGLRALISL